MPFNVPICSYAMGTIFSAQRAGLWHCAFATCGYQIVRIARHIGLYIAIVVNLASVSGATEVEKYAVYFKTERVPLLEGTHQIGDSGDSFSGQVSREDGNWLWIDIDETKRGWVNRDHVIIRTEAPEYFASKLQGSEIGIEGLWEWQVLEESFLSEELFQGTYAMLTAFAGVDSRPHHEWMARVLDQILQVPQLSHSVRQRFAELGAESNLKQEFDRILKFYRRFSLRVQRAIALCHLERFDDALAEFQLALEDTETNVERAEVLDQRAEYCYALPGDIEGAIDSYTSAIATYPLASTFVKRGALHAKKQEWSKAIDDFTQAILRDSAETYSSVCQRAPAFESLGKWREAIADYELAIQLGGDNAFLQKIALASLLATSPDGSLRNGARSLELSQSAMSSLQAIGPFFDYLIFDVQQASAAAFAETGDFNSAVYTQKQAIKTVEGMLPSEDTPETAKQLQARSRLMLYEDHKPFRQQVMVAP